MLYIYAWSYSKVIVVMTSVSGIVFIIAIAYLVTIKQVIEIGRHSIYYYGAHIVFVELFSIFVVRFPGVGANDMVSFLVSVLVTGVSIYVLNKLYAYYNTIYSLCIRHIKK